MATEELAGSICMKFGTDTQKYKPFWAIQGNFYIPPQSWDMGVFPGLQGCHKRPQTSHNSWGEIQQPKIVKPRDLACKISYKTVNYFGAMMATKNVSNIL